MRESWTKQEKLERERDGNTQEYKDGALAGRKLHYLEAAMQDGTDARRVVGDSTRRGEGAKGQGFGY